MNTGLHKPSAGLSNRWVFGLMLVILGAKAAWADTADDLPAELRPRLEAAAQSCATVDAGSFAQAPGTVVRADLDGDGSLDWVLDEAGFACSTAVSLYCGTGGCLSHFLVAGRVWSLLNLGWILVDGDDGPLVLARMNGAACGAAGASVCWTASVWSRREGGWLSGAAQWQE